MMAISFLLVGSILFTSCNTDSTAIQFTIRDQVLNQVDSRLFGQFLERATFGEPGPEVALDPKTNQLKPQISELIKNMNIPLIRFPGGTDIDYSDWRDLIDNVPGRVDSNHPAKVRGTGKEMITTKFGYDEFLTYAEELQTETLIPLNLREGLAGQISLQEAALNAAGLVAYCNAPIGAKLPKGMPDWPSIRALNGHPAPYKVKYFQLGNEILAYADMLLNGYGYENDKEKAKYFVKVIQTYIEEIKLVDPTVEILLDALLGKTTDLVLRDAYVCKNVQYLAVHQYQPLAFSSVTKDGVEYPKDKLTFDEMWYASVMTPYIDQNGKAYFADNVMDVVQKQKAKVWKAAMTEWNFNGGGWGDVNIWNKGMHSLLAKGLGAAGFLNAFIRAGDTFKIATQSNLLGAGWDIGAIYVDKNGKIPSNYRPTGLMTALYSKYHGSNRLDMSEQNVPTYEQPYSMGGVVANKKVAMIDAVVTASNNAIYFHAINRDLYKSQMIQIDCSAFRNLKGSAILHYVTGSQTDPMPYGQVEVAQMHDVPLSFTENKLSVTLPERSVCVVEIVRNS